MKLYLGGHLNWYEPQKRARLDIPLERMTLLQDILRGLGVPLDEIALIVVNGELERLETAVVSPGDHVELYPPTGGG